MAYGRTGDARRTYIPHPLAHRRVRLFLFCVFAAFLGIAFKLMNVQLIQRSHYLALGGYAGSGPEPPVPGGIYARGLEPLAFSVPAVSICANPMAVASSELGISETAREISRHTGLSAPEIRERLQSGADNNRHFVYIERLLEPEQVQELRKASLAGIWTTREYRRVYPGDRMACHILGRRSRFHEPLDGLERRWAFLLEGYPGTRSRNVDRYGRTILGADANEALPPEPGKDVVLTLDWGLQQELELALDGCMEQHRPLNATALVMDPRTGEILAMASRPNFSPAGLESGDPDEIERRMNNVPVMRQYEPGSVFKVLLAAAILEAPGDVSRRSFHCSGSAHIGGGPLRCWYAQGHGSTDITSMIARSCNIAAAQFALQIGAEHYHSFLRNLGIGQRTGIGLPGEAKGSLLSPEKMVPRDLASLGFGQGVSVSDLQMLSAVSAVVNGGRLMQPHIVRAAVDQRTNTVSHEFEPLEIRRVCSEETSHRVREMMEATVERGTGVRAAIEGLRVGGKTGTAQKWIEEAGGFVHGRNIVSFTMVAPLDEPRFAILVTADEPIEQRHGSEVAAPVAREIAIAALRQAGLLPEQAEIDNSS